MPSRTSPARFFRTALVEDIEQLGDHCRVDQTFMGGRMSSRHKDMRGRKPGGGGTIGSGKVQDNRPFFDEQSISKQRFKML